MSNSSLVCYKKISPNRTSPRAHVADTITIHCFVGQWTVERMCAEFAPKAKRASANYCIGSDGRVGMAVEEKDRSWCTSNTQNDDRAITIECASDTEHPYAINNKVYESLIDLCVDICKRNKIEKLKWKADKSLIGKVKQQNMTVHRWFAPKACPGDYIYNRLDNIAAEVNKRLGASDKKIEKDEPDKKVEKDNVYTKVEFVKDIQKAIGAEVDGVPGPETYSKTVTISAETNPEHKAVKYVQKRLKELGYKVGSVDGIAGAKFDKAVKQFQNDKRCVVDGELTAGGKTWKKLLNAK